MRAVRKIVAACGAIAAVMAGCGPKDDGGWPIPQPVSDYDMVPASGEAVGASSEALTAEGVTALAHGGGGGPSGGKYDRVKAVDYAHRYALSPNWRYAYCGSWIGQEKADCTNFASQVLYAGGIPQTRTGNEWSGWWSNGGCTQFGSSLSWRHVNDLWRFLVHNGYGVTVTDVRDLRPGDLIFYQLRKRVVTNGREDFVCDPDNVFTHSSVITGFRDGQPLVSYHSYDSMDVPWTRIANGPTDLGEACQVVKVHITY